jgi:hypothetical protein
MKPTQVVQSLPAHGFSEFVRFLLASELLSLLSAWLLALSLEDKLSRTIPSSSQSEVVNKILQISQVAALAREIEKQFIAQSPDEYFVRQKSVRAAHFSADNLTSLVATTDAEDAGEDRSFVEATRSTKSDEEMEKVIDADDIDPYSRAIEIFATGADFGSLGKVGGTSARAPTQLVLVQTMYLLHD